MQGNCKHIIFKKNKKIKTRFSRIMTCSENVSSINFNSLALFVRWFIIISVNHSFEFYFQLQGASFVLDMWLYFLIRQLKAIRRKNHILISFFSLFDIVCEISSLLLKRLLRFSNRIIILSCRCMMIHRLMNRHQIVICVETDIYRCFHRFTFLSIIFQLPEHSISRT